MQPWMPQLSIWSARVNSLFGDFSENSTHSKLGKSLSSNLVIIMKYDMQEPLSNSLLTRRASLLALVAAPGAISAGLTDRTALADDHEPLSVFRNMTPENWAALYQEPLDVRVFRAAYDHPSPQEVRNAAEFIYAQGVIIDNEEFILFRLIDTLFDSGLGAMEVIRRHIGNTVDDLREGVTEAIWVIMMGALDFARDRYEDFDLDRIRQWTARQAILAMEGIVFMGSLLRTFGQVPIRNPLLIVGAFLYAAQAADNEF